MLNSYPEQHPFLGTCVLDLQKNDTDDKGQQSVSLIDKSGEHAQDKPNNSIQCLPVTLMAGTTSTQVRVLCHICVTLNMHAGSGH